MITIKIPDREYYNEDTNEFISVKGPVLTMEHSLLSIRKWESKWHQPFMGKKEPTFEQMLDYFRCMTITPKDVGIEVFHGLSAENVAELKAYIGDSMTATTFHTYPGKKKGKASGPSIITAEVVYGWMFQNGIPLECEKWHFNQLMTLIRVCAQQGGVNPKMSKKDILAQNKALNEARKAKLGTRG